MTTVHLVPLRKNCPSVPGTMSGIIRSMPGVSDVEVEYDTRSLIVTFDETQVHIDDLIQKIGSEIGFAMTVDEEWKGKE